MLDIIPSDCLFLIISFIIKQESNWNSNLNKFYRKKQHNIRDAAFYGCHQLWKWDRNKDPIYPTYQSPSFKSIIHLSIVSKSLYNSIDNKIWSLIYEHEFRTTPYKRIPKNSKSRLYKKSKSIIFKRYKYMIQIEIDIYRYNKVLTDHLFDKINMIDKCISNYIVEFSDIEKGFQIIESWPLAREDWYHKWSHIKHSSNRIINIPNISWDLPGWRNKQLYSIYNGSYVKTSGKLPFNEIIRQRREFQNILYRCCDNTTYLKQNIKQWKKIIVANS